MREFDGVPPYFKKFKEILFYVSVFYLNWWQKLSGINGFEMKKNEIELMYMIKDRLKRAKELL